MDKELLALLNEARAAGASASQMDRIIDAYNQKKKSSLNTGGGSQTDVLEPPKSKLSVGANGQLQNLDVTTSQSFVSKPEDAFSVLPKPATVVTNDGTAFPVSEVVTNNLVETKNTPQALEALQSRISTKTATDEDIAVLAKSSGKSIDATKAYIQGGQLYGGSVENIENVNKSKNKLTQYINDFNTIYGTKYDPNDVLSSSQKTFDFLEAAKNKKAVEAVQYSPNQVTPESTRMPTQKEAIPALLPLDISNEMVNQVVSMTIDEDKKAGVPKEQTIVKIAKRTNPKEFARTEKLKNYQQSDIGELFRNSTEQDELLNYQKGNAEVLYNQAFKQNAINKISEGVLNGNQQLVEEGQHDLSQVDEDAIYKYPSLIKQEIARRVNDEIAKQTGVAEGTDLTEGKLLARIYGANESDRLEVMKQLGYLDDPRTKDIAESMAGNDSYFADNSISGGVVKSFLQPFADLGMSVADIVGLRDRKDIFTDKLKDELFQTDFSQNQEGQLQLKTGVKLARNVLNTTANLAGMLAIATATEGAAGAVGASASLGQKLGAYTSFGLPSFDASLKDSKNFLESEPTQYFYATINSIANAEGGRLLDLGKVTRIPGVSDDFAKIAKGFSEKTITEDATRELLEGAKNKYIDFAVKYGKNVTKGAATMAYFTTANNIIKLGFGDPNTESVDILPKAGHAFLDGVLGMSIMGGFGAAADMAKEKNTTYKGTIYNMALNHDAAKDVFDIGLKNGEYDQSDYDTKIAILNTSVAAKNALDAAEVETNVKLDPSQKAVYVANKTAENFLREKSKNTTVPELKQKYEIQAEKLAAQSTQTLDGLKFTPTLEPLYELYNAEKEYNAALENYEPTNFASADALEVAKKKYDILYSDYLKNNSQPSTRLSEPIQGLDEQGVPIPETVTENGISIEPPKSIPESITIGNNESVTGTPTTVDKPISTETKQPEGQGTTGEVPTTTEPNITGTTETTTTVSEPSPVKGEEVQAGATKDINLPPPIDENVEPTQVEGDDMVGITHAEIAKTRKELGLAEYGGKATETHEQLLETAQELIKGGYNLNKIFDKVRNSEPTSNVENAIMAEYKAALDVEMDNNPTKSTLKKISEFAKISDEAGTALGKGLESRKIWKRLSEADTLANFLVLRQKDKGHDLTEAQIKEQTAKFNELKKAKDELEAALKIEKEKNAALIAEQGLNKAKAIRKKEAKKTHEEYVKERKDAVAAAREALKKLRTGESGTAVTVPLVRELVAIAPHVKKAMESLVNEGVDKLDNIVNSIHADFKDVLEGISKKDIMDIIGGVHDVKKEKTANEKNADLRLLKREAELLNALQRERLGEEKAKTETQKSEKSRRIKDLEDKIKEVREQKRKRGIEDEPVRENTATAEENQAIQKRLTKRIEKLQDDLKNKRYAPEPKKQDNLVYTRKTQLLKDKVIELENKIAQERYDDERAKMSKWEKAWDKFQNVAGIRRVVQTALDASVWFRQLGSLALNPRKWDVAKKFITAGSRSVFSQTNYDRYMDAIHKSEDFKESLDDGIRYNELNEADPKNRNEFYPRSFVYKIPVVRELLTASQRVADSSLNVARYELYNKYKERLLKQGITRESDPEMYKAMAKVVMNSTGSGNLLSALENRKAEKVLGSLFYGARLMAANFNVLNPAYYAKLPKPVRAEAMKDLASYTTTMIATGLAMAAAGGKVGLNPDESGFLQVRFGDKVYDITGGKAAYVRTFLRLVKAGYDRATKTKYEAGKSTEFGAQSVLNFFRNKLSPNTSYAVNAFTGKNSIGQPFDPTEIFKVYPMYADDAFKAAKEDGYTSLLTVLLPNILGVGYASYYSEPAMKPIEETLQRNMRSDEINKATIKDYKNGGAAISDKQFQEYIEKRDSAIEKGIRDLYEGTAPENQVLDENNEVVTKKYNQLSKEQIIEATSSIKRRATKEVKEELFGKTEPTKAERKAKRELRKARHEIVEDQQ